MRKEIIADGAKSSYGILGEATGVNDLKVGDVIAYTSYCKSTVKLGVVLENKRGSNMNKKSYSVLGFFTTPLEKWIKEENRNIIKVIPADFVTVDILNYVISDPSDLQLFFREFREVKTIKLTLAQIEARLGYPVELV